MEILKIYLKKQFQIKVLRDKAFNIFKNPKYDGYQWGLASMVYNFFDKKSVMLKKVKCKLDKRIRFLLCVIDIFSKYAWVFL